MGGGGRRGGGALLPRADRRGPRFSGDFRAHYPAVFEALAAGSVVRPAFGTHPRLAIWGLVEARLQQADLVVLGGLNEGTWPGSAAADPWMSRQMRHEFGLALPERAVGIAAHDFAQACAAPRNGADPRGAARGRTDRAVALAVAARRCVARGRTGRRSPAIPRSTGRPPRATSPSGIRRGPARPPPACRRRGRDNCR